MGRASQYFGNKAVLMLSDRFGVFFYRINYSEHVLCATFTRVSVLNLPTFICEVGCIT